MSDLTPEDRIKAAFMHYVRGIAQEDLATMLGVNQGRINEACLAILKAAQEPRMVRRYREHKPRR